MPPTQYKGEIAPGYGGPPALAAVPLSSVPLNTAPAPTPPAPTSGAVVTSQPARTAADQASQYLDIQKGIDAARLKAEQIAAGIAKLQTKAQKPSEQNVQDIYNTVGSIGVDLSPAQKVAIEGMSAAEAARSQYNAEVAKVSAQLSRLQSNMEARTAATVENIKQQYDSLIEEQKNANYAYQRGVTTAGYVSGRTQYAPELQAGIVKRAVDQGIGKISDLQAKRAQLINEAEAARDEQNFKLLTTKMGLLRQNYKDEQDAAQQTLENVRNAQKDQMETYDFYGNLYGTKIAQVISSTSNPLSRPQLVEQASLETGIPEYVIDSYVTKNAASVAQSLPGDLAEYQAAINQGVIPANTSYYSFVQNYKYKADTGQKGDVVSQAEANALGAPAIAGLSSDIILRTSVDQNGKVTDTPPNWFIQLVNSQLPNMSIPPQTYIDKWNEYKKDKTFQNFLTTGRTTNSSSFGMLNIGMLNNGGAASVLPSDQVPKPQ